MIVQRLSDFGRKMRCAELLSKHIQGAVDTVNYPVLLFPNLI